MAKADLLGQEEPRARDVAAAAAELRHRLTYIFFFWVEELPHKKEPGAPAGAW
jgi:hypothetical protein